MQIKGSTLGVIAVSTLGLIGTIVACVKADKASQAFDTITSELDRAAAGMNATVPEKIISAAMERAATNEAKKVAEAAVETVKTGINTTVNNLVTEQIGDVKQAVQESLEKQLTMVDIEDIKTAVVDKASTLVAKNTYVPQRSQAAEIVKACTEAGMDSFGISRVANAFKS